MYVQLIHNWWLIQVFRHRQRKESSSGKKERRKQRKGTPLWTTEGIRWRMKEPEEIKEVKGHALPLSCTFPHFPLWFCRQDHCHHFPTKLPLCLLAREVRRPRLVCRGVTGPLKSRWPVLVSNFLLLRPF